MTEQEEEQEHENKRIRPRERALGQKQETKRQPVTSINIQAISMTVQRGNATSIMGTLGPLRKLEDFFDVILPGEEKS